MSGEIVSNDDVIAFLKSGGGYSKALRDLIFDEDKKAVVTQVKSTVATRKKALREAMDSFDPEVLVPLQEKMQGYIDTVSKVEMEAPRELTPTEALELMREFVDRRDIEEFLVTRREAIKELVFASIDEAIRAEGLDPMVTGGALPVPELGKVFKKEGAGRGEPELNENKLKKLLGPTLAAAVFKTVEVPATTVEVLDEESLMRLAQDSPKVIELIRASLTPGKPKTARLHVRDIAEEK